jgi:hypothetical protein
LPNICIGPQFENCNRSQEFSVSSVEYNKIKRFSWWFFQEKNMSGDEILASKTKRSLLQASSVILKSRIKGSENDKKKAKRFE